jgi:hypothetical protein
MSAPVSRGQNVFLILRPKFSTQVISFNLRCQCRHKHLGVGGNVASDKFDTLKN